MKHVVTLTTSNPAHEHVSLRRRQSTTNFMVEAADEQTAILRATAHFKRLGHYIHEAKIFKKKDELSENLLRLGVKAAPVILKYADDVVDAAKQLATRAKQVGTHNKETNIGSIVKTKPEPMPVPVKPAPLPVPVPVRPAPLPVPVPVKPAPLPVPLPGPKPAPLPVPLPGPKPAPVPLPVPEPAPLPVPKPGPKTAPLPRPVPTPKPSPRLPVPVPVPVPLPGPGGARIPLPTLSIGDRPDVDPGTLGQYRGLFPIYNFADFTRRQIREEQKPAINAIGRVLAKRKKNDKEDAENEKNKINMEPKLNGSTVGGSKF